jgi:hypothetical protein
MVREPATQTQLSQIPFVFQPKVIRAVRPIRYTCSLFQPQFERVNFCIVCLRLCGGCAVEEAYSVLSFLPFSLTDGSNRPLVGSFRPSQLLRGSFEKTLRAFYS